MGSALKRIGSFITFLFLLVIACSFVLTPVFAAGSDIDHAAHAYERAISDLEKLRLDLHSTGRIGEYSQNALRVFKEFQEQTSSSRRLFASDATTADKVLLQSLQTMIAYLEQPIGTSRNHLNQGTTDDIANNVQLMFDPFTSYGISTFSNYTRFNASYALYLNTKEAWIQPRVYDSLDNWGTKAMAVADLLMSDPSASICTKIAAGTSVSAETQTALLQSLGYLLNAVTYVNSMWHLNTISGLQVSVTSYQSIPQYDALIHMLGVRMTVVELQAQTLNTNVSFGSGPMGVKLASNATSYTTNTNALSLSSSSQLDVYMIRYNTTVFQVCPMCCSAVSDVYAFDVAYRNPSANPSYAKAYQQAEYYSLQPEATDGFYSVAEFAYARSGLSELGSSSSGKANVFTCGTFNSTAVDWDLNANCKVKEVNTTHVICQCKSIKPVGAQSASVLTMHVAVVKSESQCAAATSCEQCFLNPACGWCPSTGSCVEGNENGAYVEDQCPDWSWDSCPCDQWDYASDYETDCASCVEAIDTYPSLPSWRVNKRNCGFCPFVGKCVSGDASGPYDATECGCPADNADCGEYWVAQSGTCPVPVAADTSKTPSRVSGLEDTAVSLSLSALLPDPHTDTLSLSHAIVTLANPEATLSKGTKVVSGSSSYWNVSSADFATLGVMGGTNRAYGQGSYLQANVTVYTLEKAVKPYVEESYGFKSAVQNLMQVEVVAQADGPSITPNPNPVIASENRAGNPSVVLLFNTQPYALIDTDGSEVLSNLYVDAINRTVMKDFSCLYLSPPICSYANDSASRLYFNSSSAVPGLTMTMTQNVNGNFTLIVSGATQEVSNGDYKNNSVNLLLVVKGVADSPALTVSDATGLEDNQIMLPISQATRGSGDTSEILSMRISGIPDGATLGGKNSSGYTFLINNANSSNDITSLTSATGIVYDSTNKLVTLPEGFFSNLYVIPAANSKTGFSMQVTLTATEDDYWASTASTQRTISFSVKPVADAVTLTANNVTGLENSAIALSLGAALSDSTESLTVSLLGVPAGSIFNQATTTTSTGAVQLTNPASLSSLTITPPGYAASDFTLTLVAISQDGSQSAEWRKTCTVFVTPVAQGATYSSTSASATITENSGEFQLPFSYRLIDTDGSETLTMTIRSLPSGSALRLANPTAGTLTADDQSGTKWTLQVSSGTQTPVLYLSLPQYWGADFSIALNGSTVEAKNSVTAPNQQTFPVYVVPVPNEISFNVSTRVTANEDASATLGITAQPKQDLDGSEVAYAELTTTNTLVSVSVNGVVRTPAKSSPNVWVLTPSDLTGAITASLPTNRAEQLNFTATGYLFDYTLDDPCYTTIGYASNAIPIPDLTSSTCRTTSASLTMTVNFLPVADAPTTTVSSAVSTVEDVSTTINMMFILTDTDGSETIAVNVTGLPSGATLGGKSGGSVVSFTTSELAAPLIFVPAANSDSDYSLNVTGTVTDTSNVATGTRTVDPFTVAVTVTAAADTPLLSASAKTTNEDVAVALALSASLQDADGSETLTVGVAIPTGAKLVNSSGASLGSSSDTTAWPALAYSGFSVYQLSASDVSKAYFLNVPNVAGVVTVHLQARATEARDSSVLTSAVVDQEITVTAVADSPNLTIVNKTVTEGDSAFLLGITTPTVTDTDGSETIMIRVAGLGSIVAVGSESASSVDLTVSQLSTQTFKPVTQYFSGDVNLSITATSTDGSSTATSSKTLKVSVTPVSSGVTLTLANPQTTLEDTSFTLSLSAVLVDSDGSESFSMTIAGFPTGTVVKARRSGSSNDNTLTLVSGTATLTSAYFSASTGASTITVVPAPNADTDFTLTVTANSQDGTATAVQNSATSLIQITSVADAPRLTLNQAVTANERGYAKINVTAALADTDGSETLKLVLTPPTSGTYNLTAVYTNGTTASISLSSGAFTVSNSLSALSYLNLGLPMYLGTSQDIQLSAIATETKNSVTAQTDVATSITVTPVADAPLLTVPSTLTISENEVGSLAVTVNLADTDGSEALYLQAVVTNGTYIFPLQTSTSGSRTITFSPKSYDSTTFTITTTAVANETSNGSRAQTVGTTTVTVTPVSTAPSVSVNSTNTITPQTGVSTTMNVVATLVDADGSEDLGTITFHGVPWYAAIEGTSVTNTSGVYSAPATSASSLKILISTLYDSDFSFYVNASAVEKTGGSAAAFGAGVRVTVIPIKKAGNAAITASSVTTTEDTGVALSFTVGPGDPAKTDQIQVTLIFPDGISGTVNGVALSNQRYVARTYTDAGNTLDGSTLTFVPSSYYSGRIAVTLQVDSRDAVDTSDTARTISSFNINVNPKANGALVTLTSAVTALEDASVTLTFTSNVQDSSETVYTTVSGIPNAYSVSPSTGTVTSGSSTFSVKFTGAMTTGIVLTPVSSTTHYQTDFTVTLTTYTTDTSSDLSVTDTSSSVTSGTIAVTLTPVAHAPTYRLDAGQTQYMITLNEDQTKAMNISVQSATSFTFTTGTLLFLNQDSASETVKLQLSGYPTGTVFASSTGTITDGIVSASQISSLTITPPANFPTSSTRQFTFTVVAIATDNKSPNPTASSSAVTVNVTVNPLPDTPAVTVAQTSYVVSEDTDIALSVTISSADTDGSEKLYVTLTGLLAGTTVTHATGSVLVNTTNDIVTINSSSLTGLKIRPAQYVSKNYNAIQVRGLSYDLDNASPASFTFATNLTINVQAAISLPTAGISGLFNMSNLSFDEDVSTNLGLNAGLLDSTETFTMQFTSVPVGFTFNDTVSSKTYVVNQANQIVQFLSATRAQMAGLMLVPPANTPSTFTLNATMIISDVDEDGAGPDPTTAYTVLPTVTVSGVADGVTYTYSSAISVAEDTSVSLGLGTPVLIDSNESLNAVTITGVPTGATLTGTSVTFVSGTTYSVPAASLSTVRFQGPSNKSGAYPLTISASSTQTVTPVSTTTSKQTATNSVTVTVTVTPVADAPTLTVSAPTTAESTTGSTTVALTITPALTSSGETLTVLLSGSLDNVVFYNSKGKITEATSYTLTSADLTGLYVQFTGTRAYFSGTFPITVTARSTDTDGTYTDTVRTLNVIVTATAQTPTITGDMSQTIVTEWPPSGTEVPVELRLTVTDPDLDGVDTSGNWVATPTTTAETYKVYVYGVPYSSGVTLSRGTYEATNTRYVLTSSDAANAILIQRPQYYSGVISLTATAQSFDGSTNANSSVITLNSLTVNAYPSGVTLDVKSTSLTGQEDSTSGLTFSINTTLVDTSPTGETLVLNITYPTGVSLAVNGTSTSVCASTSCVWSVSRAGSSASNLVYTVVATPPAHSDSAFSLFVQSYSTESNPSTTQSVISQATVSVALSGVADTVTLTAPSTLSGSENQDVTVTAVSVASPDTDGSEYIELAWSFVNSSPSGTVLLYNGAPASSPIRVEVVNGAYTLKTLTVQPVEHDSSTISLQLSATSVEKVSGSRSAAQTKTVTISMTASLDAPTLTKTASTAGKEDNYIALGYTASVPCSSGTDGDGDGDCEEVYLMVNDISGLTGVQFFDKTYTKLSKNSNGYYEILSSLLPPYVMAPANHGQDFSIQVFAESRLAGATKTSEVVTTTVVVSSVADTPSLTVSSVTGNEDTSVVIDLTSALADTDGSERLSIRITPTSTLPADADILFNSASTKDTSSGTFVIALSSATQTTAGSITFKAPSNWAGVASFSAVATATETTGASTASSAAVTFSVTVSEVIDAPAFNTTLSSLTGNEDEWLDLNLQNSLSFTDTDGSEVYSLVLSGFDTGATLRYSTDSTTTYTVSGGKATISPKSTTAYPFNVQYLAPPNKSYASQKITVDATSTSSSSSDLTTTTRGTLTITLRGVPDTPAATSTATTLSSLEDATINLNTIFSLLDTDGSEFLVVNVSLPDSIKGGATVSYGGVALPSSNSQVFASSVLTTATGSSGFTLKPPPNYSGDIVVTLPATARESSNYATFESSAVNQVLTIKVAPVADSPTVTWSGATASSVVSLSGVMSSVEQKLLLPLTVAVATNEQASVKMVVLAAEYGSGNLFSGVYWKGEMVVPLTESTTGNKIFNFTSDFDKISLGINANTRSSSSNQVSLYVTSTEPTASSYTNSVATATSTYVVDVLVATVAQTPNVVIPDSVSGEEDSEITIPVQVSAKLDDEQVNLTISGLPAGAALRDNTGYYVTSSENTEGTYVFTFVGSSYDGSASGSNLRVVPPACSATHFTLLASVYTIANDAATGEPTVQSSTQTQNINVAVSAVADKPSLTATASSGVEDSPIRVFITPALDSCEALENPASEKLTVIVQDLTSASSFTMSFTDTTVVADTDYTVNTATGAYTLSTAKAWNSAQIVPRTNSANNFVVTVTAKARETSGGSATTAVDVPITVLPVADAPKVTAGNTVSSSQEGNSAAVALSIDLTDTDGSEKITSITLTGTMPTGEAITWNCTGCPYIATSVPYTKSSSGASLVLTPSTSLTKWNSTITFYPNSHLAGNFVLQFEAKVTDTDTDSTSTATQQSSALTLPFSAVATKPAVSSTMETTINAITTSVGAEFTFAYSVYLQDSDGSEQLTLKLSNLPSGGTVIDGTATTNSTYTVAVTETGATTLSDSITIVFPTSLAGEDYTFNMVLFSEEVDKTVSITTRQANTTVPITLHVSEMMQSMEMTLQLAGITTLNDFNDEEFIQVIADEADTLVEAVAIINTYVTANTRRRHLLATGGVVVTFSFASTDLEASYNSLMEAIESGSLASELGLSSGAITVVSSGQPCPSNCKDSTGALLGTCDTDEGTCSCDNGSSEPDCSVVVAEESVSDQHYDPIVIVAPIVAFVVVVALGAFLIYERKRRRYMIDPTGPTDGGEHAGQLPPYGFYGGAPAAPAAGLPMVGGAGGDYEIDVDAGYDDFQDDDRGGYFVPYGATYRRGEP